MTECEVAPSEGASPTEPRSFEVRVRLLEDDPRERHEGEQHGEQREEPVVRDQRGQLASSVLTELLEDRQRERQERLPSLFVVRASNDALERFHTWGDTRSAVLPKREPSPGSASQHLLPRHRRDARSSRSQGLYDLCEPPAVLSTRAPTWSTLRVVPDSTIIVGSYDHISQ
jgi:hypothetical protein